MQHVQNDHSNSMLTDKERRLLTWHRKNVEYAFGANLGDLSMKYWDIGQYLCIKYGPFTFIRIS